MVIMTNGEKGHEGDQQYNEREYYALQRAAGKTSLRG